MSEPAAVVIFAFMIIALAVGTAATSQWTYSHKSAYDTMAVAAAQAGLDHAILKLNTDENYFSGPLASGDTGTGAGNSEVSLEQTLSSSGQFTITYIIASVSDGSAYSQTGYEKNVTVQGRVYQNSTGKLLSKRDVSAGLEVGSQNFPYQVQAGYGHITLQDISTVNTTNANGRIFSNGSIRITNSAVLKGYEVGAGDFECPLAGGATYPTGGADTGGRCTAAQQVALQSYAGSPGSSTLLHLAHGASDISGGFTPNPPTDNVGTVVPMPGQTGYGTNYPSWPDDSRNGVINSIDTALTNAPQNCGSTASWVSLGNIHITNGFSLNGSCVLTIGGNIWVNNNIASTAANTFIVSDTDKNGNPIRRPLIVMVDGATSSGFSATDNIQLFDNFHVTPNKYGMGIIFESEYCGSGCDPSIGPAIPSSTFYSSTSNRTIDINTEATQAAPTRQITLDQSVLFAKWGYVGFANNSGGTDHAMVRSPYCIDAVGQSVIFPTVVTGSDLHTIDCSFSGASLTGASYVNLGQLSGKVFKVGGYKETAGGNYATINVIDTSGDANANPGNGDGAVTVGTDGFPVGHYYDRIFHCSNIYCTFKTNVGGGSYSNSTANIGSDNLPITTDSYSWLDASHCNNVSCSSNANSSVDSGSAVGYHSDTAIGSDGFPVIAYNDSTGAIKVAHCGNVSCSSGNTITPLGAALGFSVSIAKGSDNLPVISYLGPSSTYPLKVIHCGNVLCSSGNVTTSVDPNPNASLSGTSITIGSDGFPIIAYFTSGNTLRVAHCVNVSCSSGNGIVAVGSNNLSSDPVIIIGSDNLPKIFSYNSADKQILVAYCTNVSCTTWVRPFAAVVGGPLDVSSGSWTPHIGVALGSEGFPILFYYDNVLRQFRLLRCVTQTCT